MVDEPLLDVRIHRGLVNPGARSPSRLRADLSAISPSGQTIPRFGRLARRMQAYKAVDAVGMLTTLRRWSDARAVTHDCVSRSSTRPIRLQGLAASPSGVVCAQSSSGEKHFSQFRGIPMEFRRE